MTLCVFFSNLFFFHHCVLIKLLGVKMEKKKKKREKSRCLRNGLIMIHPKLMTDTDRLIKGFAVYIHITHIYGADYILRLAHNTDS